LAELASDKVLCSDIAPVTEENRHNYIYKSLRLIGGLLSVVRRSAFQFILATFGEPHDHA
jgi:hypothetical protein